MSTMGSDGRPALPSGPTSSITPTSCTWILAPPSRRPSYTTGTSIRLTQKESAKLGYARKYVLREGHVKIRNLHPPSTLSNDKHHPHLHLARISILTCNMLLCNTMSTMTSLWLACP